MDKNLENKIKNILLECIDDSLDLIKKSSKEIFKITDKNEIIYHMDLYRIEDISELDNIGFFEYLESGKTCLIEWGEMIEELIDSEYNKFTITKDDNLRIIKKNR